MVELLGVFSDEMLSVKTSIDFLADLLSGLLQIARIRLDDVCEDELDEEAFLR